MSLRASKRVLSAIFCLAAVPLASCGGAQTPSAVGTIPQAILPANVSRRDLLYVSNGAGTVNVYRYHATTLVHILTGFRSPKGLCVDKIGDVYITDARARKIFEYPHGGREPMKTLMDPGYAPYACSIDPMTGDLAVANNASTSGRAGGIAIYRHALGKPKLFAIDDFPSPIGCSYDNSGDLFVASLFHDSGYLYASFAFRSKRSASFVSVVLPYIYSSDPFQLLSAIQWDGAYWAVEYEGSILRYSIDSQGKATYQGKTSLGGNPYTPGQFWITNPQGTSGEQGTQIVAVEQRYYSEGPDAVRYWNYPAGGSPIAEITGYLNEAYGVTVSLGADK